MASIDSSSISTLITPFKSLTVELDRKLKNSLKDNAILAKQVEHYKREHGEMLLNHRETDQKLTKLIAECHRLKAERGEWEVRLRRSEEEAEELRKSVARAEEAARREKEAAERRGKIEEKLERVERERKEEVEDLVKKKKILERDLENVMEAATQRFKGLKDRISNLETNVAALVTRFAGPELTGLHADTQQLEIEGLGLSQTGETTPSDVKTASSMRNIDKTQPGPPLFVCISDDNEELHMSKGLKRKLSPEVLNEEEDGVDSTKLRTTSTRQDVKVEPNFLNKEWDSEADLLEAMGRDNELCLKAVCALYWQHNTLGRATTAASFSRLGGFSEPYAVRGIALAEFLVDGDAGRRLKRSLLDLEKFDPKGADDCRKIALHHSKQLFQIYRNMACPFFGPLSH